MFYQSFLQLSLIVRPSVQIFVFSLEVFAGGEPGERDDRILTGTEEPNDYGLI